MLFTACSTKHYEQSDTKIVTIKSPKIKFSDIGYVRHTKSAIELELFIAGHVFQKIYIDGRICLSNACMSKRSFNAEYLNKNYPENILQNIILSRAIYSGKNREKTDAGFVQKIQNKAVDITYRVTSQESFFKDRKNHILIKIRETH